MRTLDSDLPTRTARHFPALVAALCFVACAGSGEPVVFEPGDSNDAVVRAALVGPVTKTVQVTVQNGSNVALGEGAIAISPGLQFDDTSYQAFYQYMQGTWGVRQAANFARLTMNVTVFTVPAVAANGSQTLMVSIPAGSQIFYVAKVGSSKTDFVMSDNLISYPNGASGTFQTGYTVASGSMVRGNNTTGATPNISVIAFDVKQNCSSAGTMTRRSTLLSDNFQSVSNTSAWPMNSGYDQEFNGDWVTDGQTARVWNPEGGNPEAPRPVTTGFVKFLDVCPTDGATISITAHIDAQFTSAASDATLVLYYFDAANTLIRVDANHKIGRGNNRDTTLFESSVPMNTRRIAIVPMEYLAPDETGNIYYSKLDATYAPKNTYAVTAVASDTLAMASDNQQPKGWAEFGGDYYVYSTPTAAWTTLFNPFWGSATSKLPPLDTGITRRFTMPAFTAGDTLDARVFAAATFTDASSFARIRVIFNTPNGVAISALDSDRLSQSSYANLELLGKSIPAGTASVDVVINAYLGAAEKSSFYAQKLSVNAKRLLLK